MIEFLTEILKEQGIFAAISIYFIWDSRKQRSAMGDLIKTQNQFAQKTLLDIATKSNKSLTLAISALENSTKAVMENTAARKELSDVLKLNNNIIKTFKKAS